MSEHLSLLADDLIDSISVNEILEELDETHLKQLNFALRVVLNYLMPLYDENEAITRASDILAKLIRSMEF